MLEERPFGRVSKHENRLNLRLPALFREAPLSGPWNPVV
jgi:hypothetical protein